MMIYLKYFKLIKYKNTTHENRRKNQHHDTSQDTKIIDVTNNMIIS